MLTKMKERLPPLGSGDTEEAANEPGEGERLTGEGRKCSAATEEASVE